MATASRLPGRPLRNRVDPFGALHAVAARGLFTGNRGVLHDAASRSLTGRRWTTKAWIVCTLHLGDRRRPVARDVMGSNGRDGRAGWTELFFLDEVTALAAGHRPCFFCRREAALRFAEAFPGGPKRAPAMDAELHAGRRLSGRASRALSREEVAALPDGAMVEIDGEALAKRRDALLPWSFEGYAMPRTQAAALLITPPPTVEALRAGFVPVWHPSAG